MKYKELMYSDINMQLFHEFNRYQKVTKRWRNIDGKWIIENVNLVEQWDENDFETIIDCLHTTIETGGAVFGAFDSGFLKGFASIEGVPLGIHHDYFDLSLLHVSSEMRGKGIGTKLFDMVCQWAKEHNAKKLYISANSSVDSLAFYKSKGCVDAAETHHPLSERKPYDRQLEYVL